MAMLDPEKASAIHNDVVWNKPLFKYSTETVSDAVKSELQTELCYTNHYKSGN